MAVLDGDLWEHNLARVVVVDVTDDYLLMKPPLPSECYPVLAALWVPRYLLQDRIAEISLVDGYLYDWHEASSTSGDWYIGVVDRMLITAPNVPSA